MKHLLSNLRFLWLYWAFVAGGACAQTPSEGMNRFVDGLMKKMTLDEKIGQLNLPVTGEIITGQAQSS